MTTKASSCNKDKLLGWLFFLTITIAFFIHNALSPEFLDDYNYKYVFVNGSPDYSLHINNIKDIISSQYDHYLHVNGRTIVHLIVQLFSGLLGKSIFNIFNTLIFFLFVLLLENNTNRSDKQFFISISLTLALVLLMPLFGETFVWMSGAINYLWSATGILLFLYIYDKHKDERINKRVIWYLIPFFLIGWTHEAITLPMALSISLINLINIKKHGKSYGNIMGLFFLGGAAMSSFSASTIGRAHVQDTLTLIDLAIRCQTGFSILGKLHLIYIAILICLILMFCSKPFVQKFLSNNMHLILALLFSTGIVFLSGYDSERTAFGLELFSLILIIRAVGIIIQNIHIKYYYTISSILSTAIIIFYGFILYNAILTYQETKCLINQIESKPDGIIGTNEHDAGLFNSYICTIIRRDDSEKAMNFDSNTPGRKSMAATFHRDSLVFLPQALLNEIQINPYRYNSFDLNTEYELFIKLIDEKIQVDSIYWLLTPTDYSKMPFFWSPIAKRLGRYNKTRVECTSWVTLELFGHRYIIMKKDHMWDNRVRGIRIVEKRKKNQQSDADQHRQKAA